MRILSISLVVFSLSGFQVSASPQDSVGRSIVQLKKVIYSLSKVDAKITLHQSEIDSFFRLYLRYIDTLSSQIDLQDYDSTNQHIGRGLVEFRHTCGLAFDRIVHEIAHNPSIVKSLVEFAQAYPDDATWAEEICYFEEALTYSPSQFLRGFANLSEADQGLVIQHLGNELLCDVDSKRSLDGVILRSRDSKLRQIAKKIRDRLHP